jgi:hypothetical protein
MLRALAVAAVIAVGWAVAVLLLAEGLRLALENMFGTTPWYAGVMFWIGLTLIPASPAAAAWLSARYGWTMAARIIGVLAAVIALIVGGWAALGITA